MVANPQVKEKTAKMGLRCLSKDFIDIVPIRIEAQVAEARAVQVAQVFIKRMEEVKMQEITSN